MKKVLAVLAALAFAAAASAQTYKWVDKDGKVRYGDQPPPGVKATPLKGSSGPAAPAASASAKKDDKKDAKALSPEAAFRKRQQDQKEAEEKASKERAEADVRRQNCDVARANLRQLESGQRISSVNAQGERVFIDDSERAAQTQRAQKAVSEHCK